MSTIDYVEHIKPDIVIIYKKEDNIIIIEGSVPWDENVLRKVAVKRNTYTALSIQLKLLHRKSTCETIELVMGTTGMVDETFMYALKKLTNNSSEAKKLFHICQKATLLGSVRICRQILNCQK